MKTLVDEITNTDSRILRTFKDLVIQPGYVAKKYVSGGRKQYINPIRLCLVIIGSYVAFLALNGWIAPVVDFASTQKEVADGDTRFFSTEFYRAWFDLYSNHRLFIYLGSVPVAAIAIRYAFYKSGYDYVATITLLLYAAAMYSFYGILLVISFSVFGFDYFSGSRKIAEATIGLVVYFQSVRLFYSLNWFKSMFATLLIFMLLMVAAYLVTFAVSWAMVSFD